MTPTLTTLLLLTSAFHALTFAAILYTSFPHPQIPFHVVATGLFLYVLLPLAPLGLRLPWL
jgi:hypothetical protein